MTPTTHDPRETRATLPPSAADARSCARDRRRARTEELLARASRAQGSERDDLLGEVVTVNYEVATAMARRYRDRGIAEDDLAQVASEALVKAVRRFDLARHHDLLTYAVPTIRGELLRHFRDVGWTIRPPRRIQELQAQVTRATADLEASLGREPGVEEVAELLDADPASVREAVAARGLFRPTSLDQQLTGGVGSIGDLIEDLDAEGEAAAAEARAQVSRLVRRLPARERWLLRLRFVDDLTQREIGDLTGQSQVEVSRELAGILERLRADAGEAER